MFCPKCGKEIPDEATFCSYCGTEIKEGTASATPEVQPIPVPPTYVKPAHDYHTMAVLALIFSVLGGWIGLILAIIGLIHSEDEDDRKMFWISLGIFGAWVLFYIIAVIVTSSRAGIAVFFGF
jgi:hypothetical protein